MLELSADDPGAAHAVSCFYHAAPDSRRPPTLTYRIESAPDGLAYGFAPGKPPYGPSSAPDVFAFLEWRATDDLLRQPGEAGGAPATRFLHAAGAELPRGNLLLIGEPGAGKSTVLAHLLAAGYRAWGDDVVRFATSDMTFSAVPRSLKLDDKSLVDIELIKKLCADAAPGTLLAPGIWYVSPAAVRIGWEAPPGKPSALVALNAADHHGAVRLVPMSPAEAAIQASGTLMDRREAADGTEERVIESLADVAAWRGIGGDPKGLARLIEAALS